MWELETPTNVPTWIPWKSWCTKALSSVRFAHGQSWRCTTGLARWLAGWVLWKIEIRCFWDLKFGNAYKCPQMNTMKVLVHDSFEFGGFCTRPSLAVHHGVTRWLGGEFLWKNEIRDFWDVRVGKAYKCPHMNTMKVLVHESFEFGGFCTWPSLAVYHRPSYLACWVSFVKNWNSWFLRSAV